MRFEPALIEKVRKHECLYNPNHPEYKSTNIRMAVWGKIAKELNLDVKTCRMRWQNLRKFHRRIRIRTYTSGSIPKHCKRRQFDQLCFFEEYRKKTSKADQNHPNVTITDFMDQSLDTTTSSQATTTTPPIQVADASASYACETNIPVQVDISLATEKDQYVTVANEPIEMEDLCEYINDVDFEANPNLYDSVVKSDNKSKHTNPIFSTSNSTSVCSTKQTTPTTSSSLSTSSSASLTMSCRSYLSAMGAKIDEMLVPNIVRYDLEKKVADVVYEVLRRYSSNERK